MARLSTECSMSPADPAVSGRQDLGDQEQRPGRRPGRSGGRHEAGEVYRPRSYFTSLSLTKRTPAGIADAGFVGDSRSSWCRRPGSAVQGCTRLDVFNVWNEVYATRIGNGFVGSAYGPLRHANVRLIVPFAY
jgi:hypothetical protein